MDGWYLVLDRLRLSQLPQLVGLDVEDVRVMAAISSLEEQGMVDPASSVVTAFEPAVPVRAVCHGCSVLAGVELKSERFAMLVLTGKGRQVRSTLQDVSDIEAPRRQHDHMRKSHGVCT
jgi:hypothetical protein